MKIRCLVLIILGTVGRGFATNIQPVLSPILVENTGAYRITMYSGILFTRPLSPIQLIFNSSGTTSQKLSDSGYKFVINGGYFTWNESGDYIPAGKLNLGSTGLNSVVNSNLDKNLGVTVLFDFKKQIWSIDKTDLVYPKPTICSFYVGPLLIQSGQINTGIYNKISHRQKPAERTFLIIDRNKKAVFGVYTGKITLPALVSGIIDSKLFTGSFHMINLDGGSSTTIRTEKFKFGTRGRLPWRFGVR